MPINCCYNCERRTITCHATCDTYLAEKRAHDIYRENQRKQRELTKTNRYRVLYAINEKMRYKAKDT